MTYTNTKFIEFQIEALAIRHFSLLFCNLEKDLKTIFGNNTALLSKEMYTLLYFAFAGIQSNCVKFDIDNAQISVPNVKYKTDVKFANAFTAVQIIKLQRKYNIIQDLNFEIPSLNNKTIVYTFTDCFIKLINMRNKLAHESSDLNFKDSDIIEVVSDDYIKENCSKWFDTIDVSLMTDKSKSIFSNILIMDKMQTELRKRVDNYEAVDS